MGVYRHGDIRECNVVGAVFVERDESQCAVGVEIGAVFEGNRCLVTDLLADVIIYPDGFVKVVDLDELVTALESRAITLDTLKSCLNRLDRLLKLIYSGGFSELTSHIEKYAVQ